MQTDSHVNNLHLITNETIKQLNYDITFRMHLKSFSYMYMNTRLFIEAEEANRANREREIKLFMLRRSEWNKQ